MSCRKIFYGQFFHNCEAFTGARGSKEVRDAIYQILRPPRRDDKHLRNIKTADSVLVGSQKLCGQSLQCFLVPDDDPTNKRTYIHIHKNHNDSPTLQGSKYCKQPDTRQLLPTVILYKRHIIYGGLKNDTIYAMHTSRTRLILIFFK